MAAWSRLGVLTTISSLKPYASKLTLRGPPDNFVAKALNGIDAKLTTNAIEKLNLDVTAQQEQPPAVAQAWVTVVTG